MKRVCSLLLNTSFSLFALKLITEAPAVLRRRFRQQHWPPNPTTGSCEEFSEAAPSSLLLKHCSAAGLSPLSPGPDQACPRQPRERLSSAFPPPPAAHHTGFVFSDASLLCVNTIRRLGPITSALTAEQRDPLILR